MSDNREEEEDTNSSLIGTKDYWNKCYETELENYTEFGDLGEIWFGVKTSRRILDWICANLKDKCETKVLDIGCGNGFLSIELAKLGYKRLFGVDYSPNSISFCRQMAKRELKPEDNLVIFEELDIICGHLSDNHIINGQQFECIVDKGTYDAICLNPDIDINEIRDKYRQFVTKVMLKDSIFILISCNFTKDQLFSHLRLDESFVLRDEIKSPTFSFGGKVGNQVTGLILKRL